MGLVSPVNIRQDFKFEEAPSCQFYSTWPPLPSPPLVFRRLKDISHICKIKYMGNARLNGVRVSWRLVAAAAAEEVQPPAAADSAVVAAAVAGSAAAAEARLAFGPV